MIDWKLDTISKKPKLYCVAILTTAFLALLAVLFVLGGRRPARFSCMLTAGISAGFASC